MKLLTIVALTVSVQFQSRMFSADWPQWRGPDRTSSSAETGLLKDWPAGGPRQHWVFNNAGSGYSGPSVVDGRLYTMGGLGTSEHLLALDSNTGQPIWSTEMAELLKDGRGDGPRGTPAVDAGRVYALSGKGTLVCVSARNGRLLWKRTMQEFGGKVPGWGYSESVLVDGDMVLCTPGGSKGSVVALDKKTGSLVWQSKQLTDSAHYSSIIIAEPHGTKQFIKLTEDHVAGLAPGDGSLLWSSEWPGRTAVVPTPVFHDNHVYVTAGYGVGCKLVKIGDSNQAVDVYSNRLMKNHHGGVVRVGDHIYGYSDGVGWLCQDFYTGDEIWSERSKLGKGAVTYADGMLYCQDENNGTVALVEASSQGWEEHGRLTLTPQSKTRSSRGKIWTHPVVSGGKLYLRDQELVYCYDVRKP